MKKALLLLSVTGLMASPVLAQPRYTMGNDPVTLSPRDGLDSCSTGVIADQGPEGAVNVYGGPSGDLDAYDNLTGGHPIWICETDIDGQWTGIVYSNVPDQDCEVSSPVAEDTDYMGPCESGWIVSDAVEMLAG